MMGFLQTCFYLMIWFAAVIFIIAPVMVAFIISAVMGSLLGAILTITAAFIFLIRKH